MSTRTSSALALVLLAACSREQAGAAPARPDAMIECALHGAATFARTCTLERAGNGGLVVRHPDGGFRRFTAAGDGLVTSDGAQKASARPAGSGVEIAVGDDRYRIPSAWVAHDGK